MRKYPALRFIAALYFAFGIVVTLFGLFCFLIAFTVGHSPVGDPPVSYYSAAAASYAGFAAGIVCLLIGVGLIAFSESIKVFIDIEDNTRETLEAINLWRQAPSHPTSTGSVP